MRREPLQGGRALHPLPAPPRRDAPAARRNAKTSTPPRPSRLHSSRWSTRMVRPSSGPARTSANASISPCSGSIFASLATRSRRNCGAMFGGIGRDDLQKVIILNASTLIERDADFAKFAGRILLTYIYEEVLGWDIVERRDRRAPAVPPPRCSRPTSQRGVEIKRLNPALFDLDLDKLAAASIRRPISISITSASRRSTTAISSSTRRRRPHRRIETPQFFWMRVAMGLFSRTRENSRPRDIIAPLSTLQEPALLFEHPHALQFRHAPQPASRPATSTRSMTRSNRSCSAGSRKMRFSANGPAGSAGRGRRCAGPAATSTAPTARSQGVIPFLKLHNDQLVAVNQGGKRRGSGCAYLETWHPTSMDFLKLRERPATNAAARHDMNTANWIPDLFMKRVETRGERGRSSARTKRQISMNCTGARSRNDTFEYEGEGRARRDLRQADAGARSVEGDAQDALRDRPSVDHLQGPVQRPQPAGPRRRHPSSNLCTEITLNTSPTKPPSATSARSSSKPTSPRTARSITRNFARPSASPSARSTTSSTSISTRPSAAHACQPPPPPDRHGRDGPGQCALRQRPRLRQRRRSNSMTNSWRRSPTTPTKLRAISPPSAAPIRAMQGSKWDRGLLPPDTLDLLEQERGMPIEVPRGGRMDWNPLREKIATQGMRNSNVLAIAPTATISNIMGSSPVHRAESTRTSSSNPTSAATSPCSIEHLVRDLKSPRPLGSGHGR